MTRAALGCLLLASLAGCRDWEKFSDAPCLAEGAPAGCIATASCGLCLLQCRAQDYELDTATALCGAWGGILGEPRTVALQECFHDAVPEDVPQFFLGAIQATGQATPGAGWTWASDGSPVDVSVWSEDNPSDEDEVESDAENCGGFTRYIPGMNDIHCEFFPTGVLCQRPLPE